MISRNAASIFISTALPFLFACSTAQLDFETRRISENTYKILHRDESVTTLESRRDSLLFRAAELALDKGFDSFIVLRQDLNPWISVPVMGDTSSSRATSVVLYPGPYGETVRDTEPQAPIGSTYACCSTWMTVRLRHGASAKSAIDARQTIERLRSKYSSES